MELEIIKALQSIGNDALDIVCKSISYLASYLGFFFWLVVIFIFFKKSYAACFGVTYGISVGFNYAIKAIVNRPRPYVVDTSIINKLNAVGQSFPSGHTLSATIICFFLSYWINEKVQSKWLKYSLITLLVLFLLSVIFSRMYLGQHYLTDTIAGLVLGACYSIIGLFAYKKYKNRKKNNDKKGKNDENK